MQVNPNDPLRKQHAAPPQARLLFDKCSQVANGFPTSHIIEAAVNLLLNAIRQQHGSRQTAERAFDELFGRTKALLLEQHYDPATGKRRNVFPFHQTLQVSLFDARKKGNGSQ